MAILITDPVALKLTDDDDLDMSAGLAFAAGLEGFVQGSRWRMRAVKGEDFSDLDDGVPFYENDTVPASEAILGEQFNAVRARAAFRKPITETPGFLSLPSLVVGFDNTTRAMSVTWHARTIWGDTDPDTLDPEV